MTCTIIIYDFNSIPFLKGCMRQVLKYKHPDIEQRILISEQGDKSTADAIRAMFPEAEVFHLPAYGSGYAVDYLVRNANITSEYICTLDVDALPIHRNWLLIPIRLCEDYKFTFAGVHAEIEEAYGGGFFCMCQYWKVGRTADFIRLSHGGGFTKWSSRKASGMGFDDNNWLRGWSDDGVIAHWWEDQNSSHDKFTFATPRYLYVAPTEGRGGRDTDGLVFHFAFSYNWTRVGNKLNSMGADFLEWVRRINEVNFSEELLGEMLYKLIPLETPIPRKVWTNKTIIKPSDDLNNFIDNLKKT
jgi:hypothetical protein